MKKITNYPPEDHPEAPISSKDGSVVPSTYKSQSVPPDDPFSRFWSGQTADISDKDKKRHTWLNQKPERRHSVDLDELDKQDSRPYRYVLREARTLLPRPKFYSNYPDAKSVSIEYVGFILQHIVWQRLREQKEEDLECEKRESEIRRQSELPTNLTRKSRRVIPVDPIISPFDNGEDRFQERIHLFLIGCLSTHLHLI